LKKLIPLFLNRQINIGVGNGPTFTPFDDLIKLLSRSGQNKPDISLVGHNMKESQNRTVLISRKWNTMVGNMVNRIYFYIIDYTIVYG
jgi:hypothetical protein